MSAPPSTRLDDLASASSTVGAITLVVARARLGAAKAPGRGARAATVARASRDARGRGRGGGALRSRRGRAGRAEEAAALAVGRALGRRIGRRALARAVDARRRWPAADERSRYKKGGGRSRSIAPRRAIGATARAGGRAASFEADSRARFANAVRSPRRATRAAARTPAPGVAAEDEQRSFTEDVDRAFRARADVREGAVSGTSADLDWSTLDESVWARFDARRRPGRRQHHLRALAVPERRSRPREAPLRDYDLWGPLVFALALGHVPLPTPHDASTVFSIVFATVAFGAVALTLNVILPRGHLVAIFLQAISLMGYCMFPLNVTAVLMKLSGNGCGARCSAWSPWRAASWAARPSSPPPRPRPVAGERRFVYPVVLLYVSRDALHGQRVSRARRTDRCGFRKSSVRGERVSSLVARTRVRPRRRPSSPARPTADAREPRRAEACPRSPLKDEDARDGRRRRSRFSRHPGRLAGHHTRDHVMYFTTPAM